MRWLREHAELVFFWVAVATLAAGALGWVGGRGVAGAAQPWAATAWTLGTLAGIVWSLATTGAAIRARRPTVDVIALLALVGALWVGEPLAGSIVAVMLATGQLLDARASCRAERDLGLLVERAPRLARRVDRSAGTATEIPVAEVRRGDWLVVGAGEVVPVDGRLTGDAVLDESALTGEPLPVERSRGEDVRSGVVNAGGPLTLTATATADQSTYAALVALVAQAQAASAPFVRIADRIAVAFVPLTLILAGLAWALSGEPIRAVAVLVVATPCPLLLAAPIAIMSGLSRAARFGVVVKGGGALEALAAGEVVLFDKTGTLTAGRPTVSAVVLAEPGPRSRAADGAGTQERLSADDILRLAASLDQVSPHVLASSIVAAAGRRGLALELPSDVEEVHGKGVSGTVAGHDVRVGKARWVVGARVPKWVKRVRRRAALDGSMTVFVSVDGVAAGAFLLEDPIRPDAPRMVRALRTAGIGRVVLVTGDRADVADSVGRIVGVDEVLAERSPRDKLTAIVGESERARTIMVGDGVNDAPALAAAGVGVALAARGATASSEAADIVLTVDRVDALADAVLIARRARTIALQAVVVGMGLSLVAMLVAALGWLPPAVGALLQEGIDLLAIGLALRTLLPVRLHTLPLSPQESVVARELQVDHEAALVVMEQIRATADALDSRAPDLAGSRELLRQLENVVLPHERDDEKRLVPLVARALGSSDATAATSRTHAEIEHQITRLRRLLDGFDADEQAQAEDIVDLRRLLYGLYAVLRLHNAQEDELTSGLVPAPH